MAVIGSGISLRGMTHNDFHYPFYLAAGITIADVGKAVSIDASAANTVKLAADDDVIVGQLVFVEDRSIEGVLVGTIALRGGFKMKKTAPAILVGASVVGAGGGLVKAAAANPNANIVVELLANDFVVVVR